MKTLEPGRAISPEGILNPRVHSLETTLGV